MWPFSRRDGRYIGRWLNAVMLDTETSRRVEEQLVVALLFNVLSFGVREEDIGRKPARQEGLESKIYERNMDSVLLELACFRYFNFDVFLYNHHEHLRDYYSRYIQRRICDLFKEALGRRHIERIFCERVEAYGAIYRSGQSDPSDTQHLAALTYLARGNALVKKYNFDRSPLENAGLRTSAYMKSYALVHGWYMGMSPGFYEMLKDICPQLPA